MSGECRRCDECEDKDHHWSMELTFAKYYPDRAPLASEAIADHTCKHCPAIGMTCSACDGEGEIKPIGVCLICEGEGVNIVPGVFTPDDDE